MARTLPAWREPGAIAGLARLAVAARDGIERHAVEDALARIGCDCEASFLTMAPVEVSSSLVRDRVFAGEPCEGLLTDDVERYIRRQGLYR
jgi:nicotinic acid mononucleotide adenylyltransferase